MDLRRQIAFVRSWFPLFIAAVLLAGGVAFVVSSLQSKVFESKTTMIVGQSLSAVNPDYTQLLVSQQLTTTYAAVATTHPILESVIKTLGLSETPGSLAARVHADAPLDSTLLTISAQDNDPNRAAQIANATAAALIAASPAIQGRESQFQQSIDAELTATQDQIHSAQADLDALAGLTDRTPKQDADLQVLENRLATLRSTYATLLTFSAGNAANLLSVVEPAEPAGDPIAPRVLLNTLLAALFGLVVVAGIAFLIEYLDDSIKDPEVVQEVVGLNTLGIIVKMTGDKSRREIYRLATLLYPRSGAAEAYRTLRSNIEFASLDTPIRTLLVTSSVPGEGKTVTAANLAVAFAQSDRRVLLVDADLRSPGIDAIFGLENERGLTTLLRSDSANVDVIANPTEQAKLRVLTTGPKPPNPAELLGSKRMRALMERFAASVDLVIIDSPPLQAVTDAAILSSFVDGTLFVIDARRGHRRSIRRSREALANAGANVLGAVLNRAPSRGHADYGSYYAGTAEPRPGGEPPPVAAVPGAVAAAPEPGPTIHVPRSG